MALTVSGAAAESASMTMGPQFVVKVKVVGLAVSMTCKGPSGNRMSLGRSAGASVQPSITGAGSEMGLSGAGWVLGAKGSVGMGLGLAVSEPDGRMTANQTTAAMTASATTAETICTVRRLRRDCSLRRVRCRSALARAISRVLLLELCEPTVVSRSSTVRYAAVGSLEGQDG